ncbi:MAG: hypothetical protein ACW99A_05970 [Candidatus Kariarchaeaceae archaeon]
MKSKTKILNLTSIIFFCFILLSSINTSAKELDTTKLTVTEGDVYQWQTTGYEINRIEEENIDDTFNFDEGNGRYRTWCIVDPTIKIGNTLEIFLGLGDTEWSENPQFFSAREIERDDGTKELLIDQSSFGLELDNLNSLIAIPDWDYWREWVNTQSNYTHADGLSRETTSFSETDNSFTVVLTSFIDTIDDFGDRLYSLAEKTIEYDKTTGLANIMTINATSINNDPETYQETLETNEFIGKLDEKCEIPTKPVAEPGEAGTDSLAINFLATIFAGISIILLKKSSKN